MKRYSVWICAALAVEISAGSPANAQQDVVNAAYAVCNVFTNTGMVTECSVSGWNASVDVRMDTTGGEAQKICGGVVEMITDQTQAFSRAERKWKLQIFSPYSGDHPIAVCQFR